MPSPSRAHTSTAIPRPTATPTRTGPLTTGPNVRPGETPPARSADSLKHDVSGALYFAEYYMKAVDWSIATNDPFPVAQVSAPNCVACNQFVASMNTIIRERHTISGARVTLVSSLVQFKKYDITADYAVQIRTRQNTAIERDARGHQVSSHPGETDDSLVFVVWTKAGWRVREVTDA